jgi:hypothetical protein
VVSYSGAFWVANNPAKDAQVNWGTPGVSSDWVTFGSQFSMIATGLLLTENAIITTNLTLGTTGLNVGVIQSANYVAGSSGFLIRADGYAEFNDVLVRGKISTTSEKFNPANTVWGTRHPANPRRDDSGKPHAPLRDRQQPHLLRLEQRLGRVCDQPFWQFKSDVRHQPSRQREQ